MEEKKEFVFVTYINPLKFVVNEGEKIDFSIDEINNQSYDFSLLCRIIGTLSNKYKNKTIEYLVCGDGALGIKSDDGLSEEDLVLHYNDLLCKLRLGGMHVEAISKNDITNGAIYMSKAIWPVNFGESLNSHIHGKLRLGVAGVIDSGLLIKTEGKCVTIDEMKLNLQKGSEVVNSISNISTFHLMNGITEYNHRNWSSSLTYLWIVIEEITDCIWKTKIVENICGEHEQRRKDMLNDNRSYTISVKLEFLLQTGCLDETIYNKLFRVRQARNKLIHEGKMITEEDATLLYEVTNSLLASLSGKDEHDWLIDIHQRHDLGINRSTVRHEE